MTLLYYDGDCPMCHRLVIWLLERDKDHSLNFTSIQSDTARVRLGEDYSPLVELDTVVLQMDDRIYTQSTAALKAIALMPGWHIPSQMMMVVPKVLRDVVYRIIAKNRHHLWKSCPVIPPEFRDRFI